MVFCISAAVLTTSSYFVSILVNSFVIFFMPPLRAPIISGTIVTLYPGLLSLISKASWGHRGSLSLRFVSIFCCIGYVMSQIQICFLCFVMEYQVGSFFRRLNWKFQKSFALLFSKLFLAPSFFVPHRVNFNQLVFFCPSDCEYHKR